MSRDSAWGLQTQASSPATLWACGNPWAEQLMRLLLSVFLPLAVQLLGFGLVFVVSRGSGSFVGLLALGLAVLAVPLTTVVTWARARRLPPATTGRLLITGLLFALTWPLLLLVLRAIEPSL